MYRTRITATGGYLPERALTNYDLEKMMDTSDEWIYKRTGIKERHIAADNQVTSDLACEASKIALKRAGITADKLDMIIVGTCTPDMTLPATALHLQRKLGAGKSGCAAVDMNAACSGFLYSMSTANAYIKSGYAKTILVVGAELLTRIVNWDDRSTAVIFGDGAGAAILTQDSGSRGIMESELHADGDYAYLMIAPGNGTFRAPAGNYTKIHMEGHDTFKIAVRHLEDVSRSVLKKAGVRSEEINVVIPHQANVRIIEAVVKRLDIPIEKCVLTVDHHGNTAGASIPLALNEAVETGKISEGDMVLLNAFGAGITWGSMLVKW
ncbi:MAG TPA: ketoacyl-ACP synthase III [Deltaproteobacteria bacterium]|nr:ketoacyl-ACP synthase III [Deltaproteobacteria bacterium]